MDLTFYCFGQGDIMLCMRFNAAALRNRLPWLAFIRAGLGEPRRCPSPDEAIRKSSGNLVITSDTDFATIAEFCVPWAFDADLWLDLVWIAAVSP
eukprot:1824224-Amphidinium_carterae.1